MKSALFILTVGTIFAVSFAAPYSSSLLQDMQDGDKIAKAAWFGVAKRVIAGLNHAVNGEKLALNQMDDDDDLLSQALATTEEDDDDGDKKAKAAFWNIAKRVIGGLNHAVNGEKLALNQEEDDDDDLNQALLDSIQAMTQEDKEGDDDAKAEAKHYHYFIGRKG